MTNYWSPNLKQAAELLDEARTLIELETRTNLSAQELLKDVTEEIGNMLVTLENLITG